MQGRFICDSSENQLFGTKLKGYRVGVLDTLTGEYKVFTNKQVTSKLDAEAFAVLKTIECAIFWGYDTAIINTNSEMVSKKGLSHDSKGGKYLRVADYKNYPYKLVWSYELNESDNISASMIVIEEKATWI